MLISSSLVTFDLLVGEKGGGELFNKGLFGDCSASQRRYEQQRRDGFIGSSEYIASKMVELYPGYNRDFFSRAEIECGGNALRTAGCRQSLEKKNFSRVYYEALTENGNRWPR